MGWVAETTGPSPAAQAQTLAWHDLVQGARRDTRVPGEFSFFSEYTWQVKA